MKPVQPLVPELQREKQWDSAALCLDSQLRKARGNRLPINTLTYEWNVRLRSYIGIRILEKNRSNTRSQGLKAFLEMDV